MSSISLCLIEHDTEGQGLCVWSYPDSSIEIRKACIIRCVSEGKSTPYFYFKLKNDWYVYHKHICDIFIIIIIIIIII
jgi:hypothetical protein